MKRETSHEKGQRAEQLACRYLQTQGLRLAQRNYRCRLGEIDLVMKDGESLIFVEVRCRRNGRFGSAMDSVTPTKQARIIAAAQHYLQQAEGAQGKPCRFDVVGIAPEQKGVNGIIWLQDAFRLDSW
jgi:putative endonuclease